MKITNEMIPQTNTMVLTSIDNNEVIVKQHIPYTQKQVMALQYAVYTHVDDSDNDVCYENYQSELILTALVVKYYTNIDIVQMNGQEGWRTLHDWLVFSGLYEAVFSYIENDLKHVIGISNRVTKSSNEIFKNTHSLQYLIKKSFGSILTGQDLTQMIAKASEVNNDMVEVIGGYNQSKKMKGKKLNSITTANGTVVNISKKN